MMVVQIQQNQYYENQKNIKVIHNKINRGKGFSIINASKYINADNIILMDGDLEINLDSISDLINTFEILDNQVIVGCRWNNKVTQESISILTEIT